MENENGDDEQSSKDDVFFVGDLNSSEGEEEIKFSHQEHHSSCKRASRLIRESSPPLLLAFNITSGQAVQLSSLSPTSSSELEEVEEEEEEEEEDDDDDSDQPIEEWMLLGGEEQVGDSSIQLNLSYRDSCEDASGDEDQTVKSVNDTWAVSEKDKRGADRSLPRRYFSLICKICKKMGHIAKSCNNPKKCPTCVLCGIQGHIQKYCPGRPCPSCGLSHGLKPCERPQVWNQHCQRCGVSGHLSDTCPDTWRQYHCTIRLELPVRPPTVHILKKKKYPSHCCNCSQRGHHGYECTQRRMISGTFPLLPYVCHYDTIEDVLQCRPWKQKKAKEFLSSRFLPLSDQQHFSEGTGGSGEENQPVQGRRRTKQETFGQAGKRKKWPERRKERQEVKRLKRDAQAKQGGLTKCRYFVQEVCPADFYGHKKYTPPPQKRKDGAGGKSRKNKKAERSKSKKRGGIKRGNLW
ncbi:zinc finger CCHC domain-containing protein 7-like isoform X2 [Clinocottus analis]|uniref:zinc finger CCHC domain-containing protein 7-like isoform X2 n=1 Tax=Clinocottus analis TaxID=304258 RepID=UPI0035C0AF71